ncbi:protein phosphatase 1 regulatory subunit 15B-like [Acipenser ruthenus]|uniref:protein phosphatase 1 regulatory subunit 15B-like n=1 Tax=Acipenser ruthenus TaxID=7906 RepID=UPI0027408519|nr:protein phosphatase 1 regulatory subunit 15B-like [Acipenser ruthenus]
MTPYTTLWHCLGSHLCPLKVLMPGRNLIESEGDSPVSPVEMRVALPSRNKSGENFQSTLVFRPFQLAISLFRGAFSHIVSHWMTAMELMSGRKLFPSGKAAHQYLSSAFCGNPLGKSINCKDRPSLQDVRLDFHRGYEEEEKQQWESGLEDGDSDLEDTSDWLEGDSEDDCYSSDSEDELDLGSDCDWEIQPVVFKVCASPVKKESFLNKGQNSQSDLQATEHEDKVEEDDDDEDDDDSDWSDNSEESDWDDDSETNGDSKRNSELWESFFHSDDPYNPLGFSAPCRMGQDSRVEKTEMGTETPELRLETEGAKAEDDKEEPRECKHKKVRFSPVVQVHHLPECAFDDHAARSGSCWEEMARDRLRFQRRVQQISEQIDCCLQSEHRERVWKRLQSNPM